jgi:hypothetical protein
MIFRCTTIAKLVGVSYGCQQTETPLYAALRAAIYESSLPARRHSI